MGNTAAQHSKSANRNINNTLYPLDAIKKTIIESTHIKYFERVR